ncbi:hypothetical protein SB776_38690, partial [Burkholderia sp. SIMBA_045]
EVLKNGGDPSKDFNLRTIYFKLVRERVTELATTISIMQSPDGSINPETLEKALKKGCKYGFYYY